MLDEIIHRLTNLDEDPSRPEFPVGSLFTPSDADEHEAGLRATLLVNESSYYLRGYVQLIHTFPELVSALDERARVYRPGIFTSDPNTVEFPCASIVVTLSQSKHLIPVLRKTSLLNHYHWAETDEERVAVAAAALCLYNKIEYRRIT